jgi:hypothetical protein
MASLEFLIDNRSKPHCGLEVQFSGGGVYARNFFRGYARIFFRVYARNIFGGFVGIQQIQLRTEGRENVDLGAVAP